MRAYSTDLRERVVHAYTAGEGSVRELAELYRLAKNTVENWLGLFRATGRVAPRPHGGGVPATITDDRLDALCELVGGHDDATLDELHHLLEQECHIETSRAAVSRALLKAKITRKRRRATRMNKGGPMSSRHGRPSASSKRPVTSTRASSSTSSGSTST